MRTLLTALVLVLAAAPLWAQRSAPVAEHWSEAVSTREYRKGQHVHVVTYYATGQVKEFGVYRNGKPDGPVRQYSPAGVQTTRAFFVEGRPEGIWEFRSADGSPMGKLHFKAGLLTHAEQTGLNGEVAEHRTY